MGLQAPHALDPYSQPYSNMFQVPCVGMCVCIFNNYDKNNNNGKRLMLWIPTLSNTPICSRCPCSFLFQKGKNTGKQKSRLKKQIRYCVLLSLSACTGEQWVVLVSYMNFLFFSYYLLFFCVSVFLPRYSDLYVDVNLLKNILMQVEV
jgi:hypothetical protein